MSVDTVGLHVCLSVYVYVFGESIVKHLAPFPALETQDRYREKLTLAKVRSDLGPQLQEGVLQNLGTSCLTRVSCVCFGAWPPDTPTV